MTTTNTSAAKTNNIESLTKWFGKEGFKVNADWQVWHHEGETFLADKSECLIVKGSFLYADCVAIVAVHTAGCDEVFGVKITRK